MEKIKNIFRFFLPKTHLNQSLRILITINTCIVFVIGLFAPFYAIYVNGIGGSIQFAGFSWALFSIVSGVLILLFAKWELQVKDQKQLLGLGYAIRGIVFLGYIFITSITQLIFIQIIWGIAAALSTPAFDAVYTAHTTKEGSIVEWGGWEGISSIVTGIAALLGGFLISLFGYTGIFYSMSIVCFGMALYTWRLPHEIL